MKTTKIDIQRHILVPKHIKLEKKDADDLLERYNVSIKQLPKISPKDPMVKIIEAKPGDIIKIIRKSPTAGESFFYRVVSNE